MGATKLLILACINLSSISKDQFYVNQYPDGFYLTLDCEHYKAMAVKLFRKEHVCIPERPIVEITGIETVGDIHHIPNNYSVFRVTLTNEAFLRIKTTAGHLANNTMAFVLNNEVVFTFQVDQKKFNNIIEIKGTYRSRDIMTFYDQLSNVAKANK